jgi:hypothetical protein
MLRELSIFLGCLENSAKKGVAIESVISMTISLLETDSIFAVCVGLTDTTQLLKKTCTVLHDVQSIDEYVKIVDRLRFYFNKLSVYGWIDSLLLHTAEMELVYDLMFPPV